jgi:hypothetical protein
MSITKRSEPRSKPLVGLRRRKVLHRGQSPIRLIFLAARVHFGYIQTLVFCYGGIRAGADCPEHDLSQAVSPLKATYARFESKHGQ